jgi:hypothetical protein
MTEDELRALVEQIRDELPSLIGDQHERSRVDEELARALAEAPGSAMPVLTRALRSHEAIQEWLAVGGDRAVDPAGDSTAVFGLLYVCPEAGLLGGTRGADRGGGVLPALWGGTRPVPGLGSRDARGGLFRPGR